MSLNRGETLLPHPTDTVNLENAAIVAAHPDDEILWFAGALKRVRQTILCYGTNPLVPQIGDRRRELCAGYPYRSVTFLDIDEPRGPNKLTTDKSFSVLAERLELSLSKNIEAIITHNPWGEYGHQDHVRVNAVIALLARSRTIPVYVSSYASVRVLPRCGQILEAGVSDILELPIDLSIVENVKKHYLKNSCWTWRRNWRWPASDTFLRLGCPAVTDAAFAVHIIQPRAGK